jgi:ABC-type multidrug transport system fused ATPase/permease subunit
MSSDSLFLAPLTYLRSPLFYYYFLNNLLSKVSYNFSQLYFLSMILSVLFYFYFVFFEVNMLFVVNEKDLYKNNNNSNKIKCLLFLKLVFILYTIVTNSDKCYIWKDLQITCSLQRKQNKNKGAKNKLSLDIWGGGVKQ